MLRLRRLHLDLNAPYGALYFLTWPVQGPDVRGARDVLMHLMALHAFWHTRTSLMPSRPFKRLNAPYGAPRFLTARTRLRRVSPNQVLMHLMALRAF